MSYIYKTTNTLEGKVYTGQRCKDSKDDKNYVGSGKYFQRAVKEYGKENFKKEIIIEGNYNQLLLDELEKHYIQLYSPHLTPNSYNLNPGGKTMKGFKHRKESKDKMRIAKLGKSHNHGWKIGLANLGVKRSETSRQNMKEAQQKNINNKGRVRTGQKLSEEWCQAISKGKIGLKINLTPEGRKVISDRCKTLVKYRSKESYRISGEKTRKPIIQLDKNNIEIKVWNSLTEAAINNNVHISNIIKCCNGERNLTGGYKWKYKNI